MRLVRSDRSSEPSSALPIVSSKAIFAPRARAILQGVDELQDMARASKDGLMGRLRIGIIPTIGPYLLSALKTQDQFLAGFVLMFVALLTLIGTMISDMLLVLLDPRIRYGKRGA